MADINNSLFETWCFFMRGKGEDKQGQLHGKFRK